MTTVQLTQEEFVYVAELGRLRTEENANRNNIADYDSSRFNLTPLQANRLGVLVEFAIGKWLGLSMMEVAPSIWAGFVKSEEYAQYLGQPDIAGIVECRRANKLNSPLPLRRKDVEAGAFVVQGYANYTQGMWHGAIRVSRDVELVGWADAEEDWNMGEVPTWSSAGKSRVLYAKRSMNSFPKQEVINRLEEAA